MTNNTPTPIEMPNDFKVWYIAGARKDPQSNAYKEWVRRGQQLCYQVAYSEGFEDAAEASYARLMSQSSPAGRWVKLSKKLPSDGMEKSAKFTYSDGSHKLSFLAGDSKHLFIGDETMWEIANIPADVMEMWEWLDPSPQPAKEEQDWTPVSDKPRMFQNVLCVSNKGRYAIACVDASGNFDGFELEVENGEEFYTHWKPLPSLPQPLQEPK